MLLIIYSCNFAVVFGQMHYKFCPLPQILLEEGKI